MSSDRPGASRGYLFGPDYSETLVLEDGASILLRPIRPDDKAALAEAFQKLSESSRYHRFFSAPRELSRAELRFLTEVDGIDHFCLVAVKLSEDGRGEGIAAARFVRNASDDRVAEPALTVVDAWQRRGIGRAMLVRLVGAAWERGIRVFRSTLLASNVPMRRVIDTIAPAARTERRGPFLVCEFHVPEAAEEGWFEEGGERWEAMQRYLSLVARGFGPRRSNSQVKDE